MTQTTAKPGSWEDRGRKGGVHEHRMALPFGAGRRFVQVLALDSGDVQAVTASGYIRRFPAGTVEQAKAYLEQATDQSSPSASR